MTEDEKSFQDFVESIEFDDIPQRRHRDLLERDLRAAMGGRPRRESTAMIWRTIMKSRMMKIAAAVVVAGGITVSVFLMDETATPAYAVEQTVDAIKEVKTVHMAGEFYHQGQFECWLRFDGDPDVPTHLWLSLPRIHLAMICSPDGLFHYNKRTNYVFRISQDQRGRTWIIKFGSFFKDAGKAADKRGSVTISHEDKSIAVHIHRPKREQKFLVDAETKLPISFSTIRDDAPMEMIRRQQLTVKNIVWIRYNQEPPDGIFEIPGDAKVVQNRFDCWVDPDSGLAADGMTRQEACQAIVKEMRRALVDLDIETLCKLDLMFLEFAPEMWEQLRQMKEAGQRVDEFVATDDAYEEDGFWYVRCELRGNDGRTEIQTPMIKFYEMGGKTLCIIVGSKEGGVAD